MVGCVSSPTESTELTEVLGCCWLRGYGKMPYPPNLCASVISVGGSSLQETSVRSVGSVGYSSPTDYTDQHRWVVALIRPRNLQNSQKFGVLLAAWAWQDAIPSYICVNPCYLWETLLCKKLLCVPWVLWEYHCLVGAAETAAPPEIASVPSVEASSQQEISVRSVGSVGGYFKNVAAWAWQDAIPSYTMGSEMPCIF